MSEPVRPPLSLYVHLPWCVSKCPYCDFNSHKAPDGDRQRRNAAYADALRRDIDNEAARDAGSRPLQSIFIGGGTPSLFAPDQIARILDHVRGRFALLPDAEITMEANPGTLEHGSFAGYLGAGVNRLSIGAQSFDAGSLARLGRIHQPADTERAVRAAVDAGFRRINLDLMYGLPGQTVDMALADVRTALALGVEHVSHYELTLEPNTRFFANPPPLPDEDDIAEMLSAADGAFVAAGFERYEISALSRPLAHCRHNLNYWTFGDYLAVGAGAHGKWTAPDGTVWRYGKPASPRQFEQSVLSGVGVPPARPVAAAELAFEFMLNALRLTAGFREAIFEARTGLPIEHIAGGLRDARERGLLDDDVDGLWRPTPLGFRFLNDLQAMFLPPAEPAGSGNVARGSRNFMHTAPIGH